MHYIKQISTGFAVFREEPHSDKTLGNAAIFTGIDIADLVVMDESVSDDEWNKKSYDALSWEEKMRGFRMSRQVENLITKHFNGVAGDDYDQAEYDAKIALRATKP